MPLIRLQNRYIAKRGLREFGCWSIGLSFLAQWCSQKLTVSLGTGKRDLHKMWREASQNSPKSPSHFFSCYFRELCWVLDSIDYVCCMGPGAFMVLSLYNRTSHRGCWTLSLQHIEEQDK